MNPIVWAAIFFFIFTTKDSLCVIFHIKKRHLSRCYSKVKTTIGAHCVSSAYFHATDQPITRLIIVFFRSVRVCRRSAGRINRDEFVHATHTRTHTWVRTHEYAHGQNEASQMLSNASASLSKDSEAGAEAIGVNECVCMLYTQGSFSAWLWPF